MKNNSKVLMQVHKFTLLALVFSLMGCSVPLNHIGAFSKASADLANTTANGYEIINNSTIKRRISDIASETDISPDKSTFKGIITSSDLAIRIKLLRGVESYAKALGDLASADFRKDIDEASKDLYGSLGDLQQTYKTATEKEFPLTKDDLAVIATAVDAIGTAIAEDKRRTALKTVVIQADPSIQKAMKLVSDEISKDVKKFSVANMETIFTNKIKAYQHESSKLTYDQRVEELEAISKANDLTEATSCLFDNLVISSNKIALTHTVLRNAVEKDEFTSSELVTNIKELASFAKSTKEFHDKLISKTE